MADENTPQEDPKPGNGALPSETGQSAQAPKFDHHHRFKAWYLAHRRISIPSSVLILVLILGTIPFTRYFFSGLVLKKDFTLQVLDSSSNQPVSGAQVSIGAKTAETDGAGKAKLKSVKVGSHKFSISKKYYKDTQFSTVVPILKEKNVPSAYIQATGRQVKVIVTDLISKKTLGGVEIKAAGATAKTASDGSAIVVVPVGTTSEKATLKLTNYNDADITLKVSNSKIEENPVTLTPAGKIYFLSKLSGKIDVVKTNLDGTGRTTVLAGTGHEDDQNTVLLASRDWKYLALLSRRAGNYASVYLINTSTDVLSTIDEGSASFGLVGWSNDSFIYTVDRGSTQLWQPHKQALKSYDAISGKLLTLDQTNGEGTNNTDFLSETYGDIYEIGKSIIYYKSWNYGYLVDNTKLAQKTDAIYSISASGSSPQTLKTFTAGSTYITSVPYDADQIYYQVYANGSGGVTYLIYKGGKVTSASKDIAGDFNQYQQNPVTFLLSPSGSLTFWADSRDGKNTLSIGDANGENGKQIATLSDYSAYGWFSEDYLLVSKNKSELYIMPASGVKKDSDAIKITDYHKPVQNFYGYGGGYGGI